MKYWLVLGVLLIAVSAKAQFQLNGSSVNLGGGTYELTQAANNQFGAIWYKFQHDLNTPFNVEGRMNFGADPGGADGMVFVMQNSCLSAGGAGGGIGYKGMPGQSIGIEFDTYQNISGTGVELNNDPGYDHIAVETSGDVAHDASATDITAPIQMDPVLSNIKTGAWYNFKINYDPSTQRLQVTFNGSLRVNIIYDIKTNVFGGAQWVYWGFTSSTGGRNNLQQIYIDRNLSNHYANDATICSGSVPVSLPPLTTLRGTNLALKNPVIASTSMSAASQAVDGISGSRWESNHGVDPSWIYVDLQSPTDIDSVVLYWEGAYATQYKIQTSNDAAVWTDVYTEMAGDGGKDKIVFSATNIRYVRMYGIARATGYGYSIYEFQIYGQPKYLWSPNNGTISNIYSSSVTITPTVTTTYSVVIPDPCVGFTTHTFTITVDCSMPVEFESFMAKPTNQSVDLEWTTAIEKNTSYFEVLKSKDGLIYFHIGNMNAIGNSNGKTTYNFSDRESNSVLVYYKIISVDNDWSRQESNIVVVDKSNNKITLKLSVFEYETALLLSDNRSELEYKIVDMLGREYEHQIIQNPSDVIFVGKSLVPGAYLLKVINNQEVETYKIVKQK
jgi:hypothetical protein